MASGKKVAVLGGGVAGLTAAHELAVRGFEVVVYEAKDVGDVTLSLGGKAKTQFSVRQDLEPLPGEHGFRFFPSFYRHVPETMRRIPLQLDADSIALGPYDAPANGSVEDRLIRSLVGGVAWKADKMDVVDRTPIDAISDISTLIKVWTDDYELPAVDLARLTWRLTVYYFSCNARRKNEWQKQTLWQFLDADTLSQKTQDFLSDMPKALAAMDAKEGNARSMLNVLFLWAQDFVKDRPSDRILSGPTTKAWIEPWCSYLKARGVTFVTGPNARVTGFTMDGTKVVSAQTGGGADVSADHFICALPLEAVHEVCEPTPRDVSRDLDKLLAVPAETALRNMIGVQFFLKEPRPLVKGLINYMASEWGITSISEPQYWDAAVYQLPADCKEVFSAIVTKVPTDEQNNVALSLEELKAKLLQQLEQYEGPEGNVLLDAAALVDVHVDSEVEAEPPIPGLVNHSRHLIHPPAFQAARVGADVGLQNMFFAGDHVRGYTDLATMEGANESARRAVNCLLERLGLGAPCAVIDQLSLDEPAWLKAIKTADELLYFMSPSQALESALLPEESAGGNPFEMAVVKAPDQPDATPQLEFDLARSKQIEQRMFETVTKRSPFIRTWPGTSRAPKPPDAAKKFQS